MGKVLKRNVSNSWLEYTVAVEVGQEEPVNVCGLCANEGILDTTGNVRYNGSSAGVRAYCICPVGRAKKKADQEKKWGGSSVMEHDPDANPVAQNLGWEA